jgi:DNA mismatch repair protein MutL
MSPIRILPPEVVTRIAAGEIVERPASVLKELIENAIDASATEVAIDLEDGGRSRILVRDNGVGIEAAEMPLAFERHATSKLSDEDLAGGLFGAATLGFRGEALASIASVATVEMTSMVRGAEHGNRYRPGGGPPGPAAFPGTGTAIEVRNLFHAVPARRKFLRAAATELAHAVEEVTRLALGFPGISFRLSHGGKPVLDLPPADGLAERLRRLIGRDKAAGLVELRRTSRAPPALEGFIGGPRLHRRDTRWQHFFVNGRWIRDRLLAHALRSAYQGFQIPGHQPVAWLFLELPPGDVDVNVHPTKTEVRFRESSEVYRLVHGAVREALAAGARAIPSAAAAFPGAQTDPADRERAAVEAAARDLLANPPPERPPFFHARPRGGAPPAEPSLPEDALDAEAAGAPAGASLAPATEEPGPRRAVQVLESYILLEAPDGLVLIDQHAFHEKIIFEEVHRRLARGRVESQRLLVPEVIDVPPERMPLVEPAAALLLPLGFEIEPFGPATVAIHAFPALFDREAGKTDLGGIVRAVLDDLAEGRREAGGTAPPGPVEDAVRRIAAMIACKRAVKAGMPLSPREVQTLLARGSLAEDPRHCPHGRPTSVVLSRRDLERRFDRK